MARQLIVESVILTLLAAAAGLVVGYGALRLLGTLNIQELPRGEEIRLDGVVVAYTIGVAALIGLVLGLIPVASVLPANLNIVLREEGRSGTSGRGARTLRRALVVAQVAFAFVLLVGAGLLFASFRRVLAVDPGFNPDGVMTASVSLPRARYKDDTALVGFTHSALQRLAALPGVSRVGATDTIPFGGNSSDSVIFAEGYQMKPGESVIAPNAVDVTPGYFEAMSVRLVRGRFFDERDGPIDKKTPAIGGRPNGAYSIIVDETLAKRFWSGQDPIGRRMYKPNDIKDLTAITEKTVFYTVVGVIGDIKLHDLTEGGKSVGTYFFPMDQDTSSGMTFALKTAGRPVVADERRPRRPERTRSRAAGLRHADDGSADGEIAGQPSLAGRAVAGLRRRRAVALGDRHLWRPRLSRHAAPEGNRYPHRSGQQRARHLRAGAPGRSVAHRRRLCARSGGRAGAAQEPREPAVRGQRHGSARAGRGHRPSGCCRGRGLRATGATSDENRPHRVRPMAKPARRATRIDPIIALAE